MELKEALHSLVQEVADGLVHEIRALCAEDIPTMNKPTLEIADTMAKEVAMEVAQELPVPTSNPVNAGYNPQQRLAALERQLEKLTERSGESSQGDSVTNLPNLKYAKSKYRNVESLLNYIETKEAEGGIKLVIMNFND